MERGRHTWVDLLSAAAAAVVLTFNLPGWLESSPVEWVIADVCAAVLLLVVDFGRGGACACLLSVIILLCSGFVAVWMIFDGLVWPPLLFGVYTARALWTSSSNPRGAMEEIARVHLCAMGAGLPTGILAGWSGWGLASALTLTVGFFLLSAWLQLYPALEWLGIGDGRDGPT